jgi:hypothetical protein
MVDFEMGEKKQTKCSIFSSLREKIDGKVSFAKLLPIFSVIHEELFLLK